MIEPLQPEPTAFSQAWNSFTAEIERASGQPFVAFTEGHAATWEGYKPRLRELALARLDIPSWTEGEVGSGKLVESAIRAIEIHEPGLVNNLVDWPNRYGHTKRAHRVFLDALDDTVLRKNLESWLLEFFHDRSSPEASFEKLVDMAGKRYDLIAYLFFLKDEHKYMPISPVYFDRAFEQLGIELVTVRNCSWENYASYNAALEHVRQAVQARTGLEGVRLIDAHSFCWMLVRMPQAPLGEHARRSRGGVRVFDAREKSIYEMVNNTKDAVRDSGRIIQRQLKEKELRMTDAQLEDHIKRLLKKQNDQCALTGIPLQFRGDAKDDNLLPSLDRIRSDGHYEAGNLQVVCRFINMWKSDTDDEEFRRLLALVRNDEPD